MGQHQYPTPREGQDTKKCWPNRRTDMSRHAMPYRAGDNRMQGSFNEHHPGADLQGDTHHPTHHRALERLVRGRLQEYDVGVLFYVSLLRGWCRSFSIKVSIIFSIVSHHLLLRPIAAVNR